MTVASNGVPSASEDTSAWAPLKIAIYRNLFIAQLVSNVGTWMQTVGAQWFLVEHHSSATVVALVQTASLTPTLVLGLFGGVFADLFDRRRLLIVIQTYAVLATAALAALAFIGVLTPTWLLGFTVAIGCCSALTAPAWQAIQPELVPREQIPAAASLGSVTVNVARAIGPALAGVVILAAGPAAVFALNAASFAAIIVALRTWKRPGCAPSGERESIALSILAALRWVRHGPVTRRILLRSALFAFPASALWALLPVTAAQHWRMNSCGYGLVLAALGVGAVIGVVLIAQLRRLLETNTVLAGSAGAYALGLLVVAIGPFDLAVPLLLVCGMAWIATLTTLNAAVQLSLPPWVRARVMAVYLLVFSGSQALGSYLWGLIAAHFGLAQSLSAAAALLVLTALSVTVLPLRPETGTLDLTTSTAWPTPTLVFQPEPSDGPVLISTSYRVTDERIDQFAAAMLKVGRSRSRTGGYRWRLYRSGEDPQLVIEEFTVPSWAEFDRQHSTRWLASDNAALASALQCTVDGRAEEHWYFALAGPTGVLGGPSKTSAATRTKRSTITLNGIVVPPWADRRV
ncbi:MFS transporter [Mycobacterium sp. 1245111.1]|nr:MFS transporter [Mycobacterium sp. 1245111.1]